MKKKYVRYILITLVSCHFLVQFCYLTAKNENNANKKQSTENKFDDIIYNWTRTFAEAVQTAKQKHFKIQDPEQCMISAISSFLTCLDPHSSFLDPKTYQNILESTSGEFFGIGVVIDNTRNVKDKFLLVIDTIPEGPADKAGIKPLDKIVEVEGKPLEDMTTEKITAMLKGKRHTTVTIKVLRDNKPNNLLSFTIERDTIKEQSTLCFYLNDYNIYYISLNTFSEQSYKQIAQRIEEAKKKQYKGLILDLRNNSGGLLTVAINIASLFLEQNSLVVTNKNKYNNEIEKYVTKQKPANSAGIPIFILINNYTASAAEILAGALKIHSENNAKKGNKNQKPLLVFLVGTKTFGKGSVQEVIPISNNCAIKITSSLYYLPNDTSIQGIGIEPDFVIEKKYDPPEQMVWFTKFYGREQTLANYIKNNNQTEKGKSEKEKTDNKGKEQENKKSWAERTKKVLEADNQFRETISLINFLHTAQTTCPANVKTRDQALKFLKSNYITNEPITMTETKL